METTLISAFTVKKVFFCGSDFNSILKRALLAVFQRINRSAAVTSAIGNTFKCFLFGGDDGHVFLDFMSKMESLIRQNLLDVAQERALNVQIY